MLYSKDQYGTIDRAYVHVGVVKTPQVQGGGSTVTLTMVQDVVSTVTLTIDVILNGVSTKNAYSSLVPLCMLLRWKELMNLILYYFSLRLRLCYICLLVLDFCPC